MPLRCVHCSVNCPSGRGLASVLMSFVMFYGNVNYLSSALTAALTVPTRVFFFFLLQCDPSQYSVNDLSSIDCSVNYTIKVFTAVLMWFLSSLAVFISFVGFLLQC